MNEGESIAPEVDPGALPGGVLLVPPAGGRRYEIGDMRSRFLADGEETEDRYSASEWWLEEGGRGPGPHSHAENVEIFLVLEGTMGFLVGERRIAAPRGTFLRIPAGVVHDFWNDGEGRAGVFNLFIPGGFEAPFVAWLESRGD